MMMAWINCNDKFPNHDQEVLACDGSNIYICLFYRPELINFPHYVEWYCCAKPEIEIFDITHWMPLPDPPEDNNEVD